MKNTLALLLCLLLVGPLFSQKNDSLFIGQKLSIYSKILGENRPIWVYSPAMTSANPEPGKRYPVLYVLDGDAHFFSTVGLVQQLSQANGNGVLPEMIVVAIPNTNRLRDLSPVSTPGASLEKANPFVRFMANELMPFVEKQFPTSPYKVLVGHSLGGLTAVDILANQPQLFNAYIALDPSMWYNNERHLNNTMAQLLQKNMEGKKLYMATANSLPKGMTLAKLKTDATPATQHMRSMNKLNDFLVKNKSALQYSQAYYEKEKHNSLPLMGTYDGLKFVFNFFWFEADEQDFADSSALMATKLRAHYAKVSKEMGYTLAAPESLVNYLGYDALGKKQFNKAGAFFQLNVDAYPNSNNVYDSYGDYFVAKKDTAQAIVQYKKSLSIKNELATARKLSALEKPNGFVLTSAELQKYQGTYTISAYKIDVVLRVYDGRLWSSVSGQPDGQLVPLSKDVFTVKGQLGYTISFEMKGDKPVSFTSVQPNGTFYAVFKNQ